MIATRRPHLLRRGTNPPDHFSVIGKVAVRKIQPGDVESGANQAPEHLRTLGSRSDRRDELRFLRG